MKKVTSLSLLLLLGVNTPVQINVVLPKWRRFRFRSRSMWVYSKGQVKVTAKVKEIKEQQNRSKNKRQASKTIFVFCFSFARSEQALKLSTELFLNAEVIFVILKILLRNYDEVVHIPGMARIIIRFWWETIIITINYNKHSQTVYSDFLSHS